jgi:hypothetical protein
MAKVNKKAEEEHIKQMKEIEGNNEVTKRMAVVVSGNTNAKHIVDAMLAVIIKDGDLREHLKQRTNKDTSSAQQKLILRKARADLIVSFCDILFQLIETKTVGAKLVEDYTKRTTENETTTDGVPDIKNVPKYMNMIKDDYEAVARKVDMETIPVLIYDKFDMRIEKERDKNRNGASQRCIVDIINFRGAELGE